jgi:DGQHR domain-containing protein
VGIVLAFDSNTAHFVSTGERLVECLNDVSTLNGVDGKLDRGVLSFYFDENAAESARPALVVDGQHRLKAIAEIGEEDIPLLTLALVDATSEEQAFQFVVINNKAAKVPTDNVKAIIATFDEERLQDRLLNAGVSYGGVSAILKEINEQETSPFYKLLDWPLSPGEQKVVQLTAIEACLRYIKNQFPSLDDDEDTQKELLLAIWSAVKEKYPSLWIDNQKFMSKVNILALNEFITDRLSFAYEGELLDIYQEEPVKIQTSTILNLIPEEFWIKDWKIPKLQDNGLVRSAIKEDLKLISHNTRAGNEWFENTKLIGESGV